MKQFFSKFITLLLFLLAATLTYFGVTVLFKSFLINICLIIFAIFFLIQACANVDKNNGLGRYAVPEHETDGHDDLNNNNNNREM